MVRALDEIDRTRNLLRERADSWIAVTDPHLPRQRAPSPAPQEGGGALDILQDELCHLQDTRRMMAREVSATAATVLPNCSALVGGLVAARLLSEAGDLHTLATMPASTLQVIGARKALFSHLQCGTAPPRHGIIYQDKAVHTAPGKLRGKVARTVACQLAIAAKLDQFRREAVPGFLAGAQARIARARGGLR
jgi:nucleolar protein 56